MKQEQYQTGHQFSKVLKYINLSTAINYYKYEYMLC